MVSRRNSQWMGSAHQGATPKVGSVATGFKGRPSPSNKSVSKFVHPDRSGVLAIRRKWVEQARKRVGQLQTAIQVLDPTDPARPVLEDALKKAKGQATLPSLEEQIQSTEQFVVRAKERLEEAEKEVVAITEKRDGLRAELATSEESLARLRQDVSFAGGGQATPQFHIPAEVVSELERLRSMVANAAHDRDSG